MASLKETKDRISSVKNTLKITSAMKMVASAKLHKAQTAIENMLPYEQKLHHILGGMLQDKDLHKSLVRLGLGGKGAQTVILQDFETDALPVKDKVSRVAVLAISSNTAMCGAFNANVIRHFNKTMDLLHSAGYADEDIDIYVIGRKIAEAASKAGYNLAKDYSEGRPDYVKAEEISNHLIEEFSEDRVQQVILVYNHMASAASQPSIRENYLPISLRNSSAFSSEDPNLDELPPDAEPVDYILEPDPIAVARILLPKVLVLKIYTVLLDADAAEHAARTLAMQIASDNATDLIAGLTLEYNKARQQAITAEILDLVGGTIS